MSDPVPTPRRSGFTQTVVGLKAAKLERARAASPSEARLRVAATMGRKAGGIAAIVGGVMVWRDAMRTNAKILAGASTVPVSHFDQYVAIGLAFVGMFLLFPDEARGIFAMARQLLPWGKKDTP